MDFLAALNPQQKKAVTHAEGPLLILAGAGSGKTRVIISRMAYLIREKAVPAYSLLAVTFTNKAAEEMRNRVARLLEGTDAPAGSLPLVSTFHSFCVHLLRSRGEPLSEVRPGFTTRFNIYDDADQLSVVKSVYKELGLDESFKRYRAALAAISQGKNQGSTPGDFYASATSPHAEKLAVIFERYQGALQGSNALDFDDLLLEGVRLLRHSQEVREATSLRYRYVMVDEYQDTNRPQYDLMRLLSPHKNICVVGDEDQSIYSWRGADIRNILDFEKDFPGATVIHLEQNYRSTKKILAAASTVVANNVARKGKTLWTDGEPGSPILFYRGPDGENEALYVADQIHRYLNEEPRGQAAVLYRTNSQSRQIEEALRRYNRKYVVVGGAQFLSPCRSEGLSRLPQGGRDTERPRQFAACHQHPGTGHRPNGRSSALKAMPSSIKSRCGKRSGAILDEKVFATRAHTALFIFWRLIEDVREELPRLSVDQLLAWLAEHTGYRQMLEKDTAPNASTRLENIDELLNAAADAASRGEDVHAFLDHAALVSETDDIDERAQVLLMSLHAAKGLEFPLVAMVGMEESLFPHSRSLEDESALEEERRLCYVGMTRARSRLMLTCARRRRRYGAGTPQLMTPSRFLWEVPLELLDDRSPGRDRMQDEWETEGVDLLVERHEVRQTVSNRIGDRKTYNSAENIADFFSERGIPFSQRPAQSAGKKRPHPPQRDKTSSGVVTEFPTQRQPQPRGRSGNPYRLGAKVRHAKYGVGTVMRRESVGDDIKLSVMFQRHGMKKLMTKYAGLQPA